MALADFTVIGNNLCMVRPYHKPEDRADVFRGLANAMRRRLIDHLRAGPMGFDELQTVVPVRQPTLSSHLSILRECGLIDSRTTGGRSVYRLRPQAMSRVARWAQPTADRARS